MLCLGMAQKDESQEAVIKTGVNLVASPDICFQFPSQVELNRNDETQETIRQQHLLSLNNCTVPVDQLSDNSRHLETSNSPFHLEDSRIQEGLNFTKESNVSAAINSDPGRSFSKNKLQRSLHNTVHSEGKVAMVSESSISRIMNRMSDQSECKDYSPVVKKRKRISVGAGILNEDEVSSPEISKCSTWTQTLLDSNESDEGKDVFMSSSLHGTRGPGICSSSLSSVDLLVFSRLPYGATLVIYQGIFATIHMDKPFACVFCGESSREKNAVFVHSIQLQNEKLHFLCDPCHHKLTNLQERQFSCNFCNKSFNTRDDLVSHSKVHKEEELRKSVICKICKMAFQLPSALKQHMIVHSGE